MKKKIEKKTQMKKKDEEEKHKWRKPINEE